MEAALKLFSKNGYHGTSIGMIAREAGVSTGLMYNYFEGKDALLEAIVRDGMERIEAYTADIERIKDARKKIRAMIELSFEVAQQDMRFWTLYFNVVTQPDLPEDVSRIFAAFITGLLEAFEATFEQLGYPDPVAEARVLGAILDGVLLHFWLLGETYPIDRVKNLIIKKYCKTE